MEYIFLSGEIGYEITPSILEDKFNNLTEKEVTIYINSVGGFAFDGIALYDFLKLKQSQGYIIHTVGTGVTASAGTLPYLAGKKETREVHNTTTFLIHEGIGGIMGGADDMAKQSRELQALNNKIAEIYEVETDLTKEEALEIMAKDESSNAEWLVSKGFASKIKKYEAVASIRDRIKLNKQMTNSGLTKEDKNFIQNAIDSIKNVFSPKAKIVQDANGDDIDFYELEADATPSVGDKARIDDKPAEGEVKIPSGKTYVFVAGELTEIKEDSTDEPDAEIDELKAQVQAKETELAEVQAKLDKEQAEKDALNKKLNDVSAKFDKLQDDLKTKFDWDGNIQNNSNNTRKLFK